MLMYPTIHLPIRSFLRSCSRSPDWGPPADRDAMLLVERSSAEPPDPPGTSPGPSPAPWGGSSPSGLSPLVLLPLRVLLRLCACCVSPSKAGAACALRMRAAGWRSSHHAAAKLQQPVVRYGIPG